jgi:Resolvase, N terminal domain
VLVVTRLDRLARSTRDLLNILDAVAKAGAGFKSLGDAWADTTTPHGRLMLTVLGGLAEFERELIIARTRKHRPQTDEGAGEDRKHDQACEIHAPFLSSDRLRLARDVAGQQGVNSLGRDRSSQLIHEGLRTLLSILQTAIEAWITPHKCLICQNCKLQKLIIRSTFLNRFEVGQNGLDLVRLEHEFRHVGMAD